MDITVRVEVQYVAPERALIRDVLQMFRTPGWVRFMVRYISPHLKNAAPADKSVMEKLTEWKVAKMNQSHEHRDAVTVESSCVICMSDLTCSESESVDLPCGHSFHHHCIESWLKLRSTCPTCRFQFRKAFSGSYAVRTLNSALLLKQEHRHLVKDEILNTCVGKETVRAVVNVTLSQIASQTKQSQYPCVLNALMIHSNGESIAEVAAIDKNSMESSATTRSSIGHVRHHEDAMGAEDGPSLYEQDEETTAARNKRVRVN